jgi:hypothetical protein
MNAIDLLLLAAVRQVNSGVTRSWGAVVKASGISEADADQLLKDGRLNLYFQMIGYEQGVHNWEFTQNGLSKAQKLLAIDEKRMKEKPFDRKPFNGPK